MTVAGAAPAPGALVTGEAQDGARVQVIANDDGCFDLGTPPAGVYRIWAESRSSSADAQQVEIADGWPETLHFDLPGSRQLAGRVIADGQPVASARQWTWLNNNCQRGACRRNNASRVLTA